MPIQDRATQQFVLKSLERLRHKLLDLTTRNPLLAFRHGTRGRRHIRVIDELPDELYNRLQSGTSLRFKGLPDPDDEPDDEQTIVFQRTLEQFRIEDPEYLRQIDDLRTGSGEEPNERATQRIELDVRRRVRETLGMPPRPERAVRSQSEVARAMGLNPSYDLPHPVSLGNAARHTDNAIQTLNFREAMDRILSGIRDQARLSFEETGVHTLFAAFGFLEWYDTDTTDRALYAPLLLYPLQMERELVHGHYRYSVSSIGEDSQLNLALKVRLKRDFSVALPELEEDDSPEDYFSKVARVIEQRPQWKVRRWITVGLFSFARIAMYEDLDPDRWPDGRLTRHEKIRTVLAGCDQRGRDFSYAEDRDYEATAGPSERPLLIHDADTSQVSAILDALDGQDLVIEGPPGTGKSQTITNLIAAAIANGKTVLFVAEKMAALNVVYSRLKDAGLGDFCFEMHSTKARRREAIEALKRRLDRGSTRRQSRELESAIEQAQKLREGLRRFVVAMNSEVGQLGVTVQEAIWACQRLRDEHPDLPTAIDAVDLEHAETLTQVEVERISRELKSFAEQRAALLSEFGSVRANPWFGVANPDIGPFAAEEIVRVAAATEEATRAVVEHTGALAALTGLESERSLGGWQGICAAALNIEPPPSDIDPEVVAALADNKHRDAARRFIQDLHRFRQVKRELAQAFPTAEACESCDPSAIHRIANLAHELSLDESKCGDLHAQVAQCDAQANTLEVVAAFAAKAAARLAVEAPVQADVIDYIVRAIRLAAEAPLAVIAGRYEGLLDWQAPTVARRAIAEWRRLREERQRLDSQFAIPPQGEPGQLQRHAVALRGSWPEAWISIDYWRARQAYRSLERYRARISATSMAQWLDQIGAYLRDGQKFNADATYLAAMGPHFRGLDTDFKQVAQVVEWGQRVRDKLGAQHDSCVQLRRKLFGCSPEEFEFVRSLSNDRALHSIDEGLPDDAEATTIDEAAEAARHTANCVEELRSRIEVVRLRDDVRLSECGSIAKLLKNHRDLRDSIERSTAPKVLRIGADAQEGSLELCSLAVDFAECVMAGGLPDVLKRWLLSTNQHQRTSQLQERVETIVSACVQLNESAQTLLRTATVNVKTWLGCADILQTKPSDLAEHVRRCVQQPQALHTLIDDQRLEREVRKAGLDSLLSAFEKHRIPISELPDAFLRAVYHSLARAAVSKASVLGQFTGMSHEGARTQYREIDRRLQHLFRERLANDLSRRDVEVGSGTGARSTWTQLSLLQHQVGLQRRHAPLRDLLHRAGKAIQQLMPCFMMSPLSVAQYLRSDGIRFDLVIMDEASQLRPQDALGAIARGSQVVIVGDPKQLPPTEFFMGGDGTSQDEDEGSVADDESILDASLAVLRPARRLKWHYRSRHSSLIDFSNGQFYDDDLVIFPSPYDAHEHYGVRYVHVSEGRYTGRVNTPEVQRVAEAAIEFMQKHPNRSLGIVTMNQPQRDALQLEMDRLLAENPESEEYRKRWDETLEPLFVKNLENVQGDERDAIFISTVYGRDPEGNFFQRFGPINQPGGHRRLNVLFTRAKYQTVVFSSMDPGDIRVDETSSRGLQVLKSYLLYAKEGHLARETYSNRPPDSDFEICVATVLRDQGYEVVPQLGVSGYFIDIAVRHPAKSGVFILAVECDGATYHSAKSARDRDRLRQEVLERLGWKVHRIWSLDWYRNPKREGERLLEALRKLRSKT